MISNNNQIVKIISVSETSSIIYRVAVTKSVKNYPLSSRKLNIKKIVGYYGTEEGPLSLLSRKCIVLPAKGNLVTHIRLICIPFCSEM